MGELIVISSYVGHSDSGCYSYNGGTKLYNIWVKLLRQNGHDAYLLTYDGTQPPWLIEPAPSISVSRFKEEKKKRSVKYVTGWLPSEGLFELIGSQKFYFCDCELHYTSGSHGSLLREKIGQINRVCVNNRFYWSWYACNFPQLQRIFVPEWSDEDFWKTQSEKRKVNRVGYMCESDKERNIVEEIQRRFPQLEFVQISGNEKTVLGMMQSCDIFLGLNMGKSPVWGEGCPRTQQEAMHAGAVLIAFDSNGNREYLIDGFTGFLVEDRNAAQMSMILDYVVRNPFIKEQVRSRSIDFSREAFSSKGRYKLLKKFLDL